MRLKLIALLAFISIGIQSCDIGDDGDLNVLFEVVPVLSVEMPESFVFGEVNEIDVTYSLPTACHEFNAFNVQSNLNNRDVRVVTDFINNGNCEASGRTEQQTLQFLATSNGSYNFRFFNGFDENNEPKFLEFEVDVEEND